MSNSPEAPKTLRERFMGVLKQKEPSNSAPMPEDLPDIKLYCGLHGYGLEVAGYRLAYDSKRGLTAVHPSGEVHVLDARVIANGTLEPFSYARYDKSYQDQAVNALTLPKSQALVNRIIKDREDAVRRTEKSQVPEDMPPPRPRKDYFYDTMLYAKDKEEFIEKLEKDGFRLACHTKRGLAAVRYTGKVYLIGEEVCRGLAWQKLEPISSLPSVKQTRAAIAMDIDFRERSARAVADAREAAFYKKEYKKDDLATRYYSGPDAEYGY